MYQTLIGRLIYLAHTWPDVADSMSVISQFMHDPKESHLQATEFCITWKEVEGQESCLKGMIISP